MARRKKETFSEENLAKTSKEIMSLQVEYNSELETNPEFSLKIDPLNKYNLNNTHKKFIQNYINYRNLDTVSKLMNIPFEESLQYYNNEVTQIEIRRINKALYHRRFASKLLDLDELGGYLSTLLTEEYVPKVESLGTVDKLKVVDMLLKIINMKKEAFNQPSIIMEKDIDYQIKELSVDSIKNLLAQKNLDKDKEKKGDLIKQLDSDQILSDEEKMYLESLSTKELIKLLNETNKISKEDRNE